MSDETQPDEKSDFKTIRRVFAVFDGFGGPDSGGLNWRVDEEYAPVTLWVNCNDLFVWGCADSESIGPSTIAELEQAVADAKAAGAHNQGDLLYCARRRKMRPQGAFYKYFKEGIKPLFDACGPERETGLGNPSKQDAA